MAAGKELLLFQWGQLLFFLLFILISQKTLRYLLFSIFYTLDWQHQCLFWKNRAFGGLLKVDLRPSFILEGQCILIYVTTGKAA